MGSSGADLSGKYDVNFTLNSLTIAHGRPPSAAAASQRRRHGEHQQQRVHRKLGPSNSSGGALYNGGTVTISDSTFTDNSASFGMVYNTSTGNVNITGSTFTNNTAPTSTAVVVSTTIMVAR